MMDTTAGNAVIHAGQIEIKFLLRAAQTARTLTMFEFVVPAQARVPIAHSHEAFDETVYGLSGVLTWTLDDQQVRVGPGDVLFIPRGHVHHLSLIHISEPTRLLSTS